MRSTYREESERALKNGGGGDYERVRANRPRGGDKADLFGGHIETGTPTTTSHRREFAAKQTERTHPNRPKTSDLWKVFF